MEVNCHLPFGLVLFVLWQLREKNRRVVLMRGCPVGSQGQRIDNGRP